MISSILSIAAPLVIWLIGKIFKSDDKKIEMRKRYFDYIAKRKKKTPQEHGQDLSDIMDQADNDENN